MPHLSAEAWSAIATVVATVVALGIAVGDIFVRRAEKRDNEMAQARLVSGTVWSGQILIRNDSQLPIFDVRVFDVSRISPEPHEGLVSEDSNHVPGGGNFTAQPFYSRWDASGSTSRFSENDEGVAATFEFLDAAGLCWQRRVDDRVSPPKRVREGDRVGNAARRASERHSRRTP